MSQGEAALAAADVGIAMGEGSDVAMHTVQGSQIVDCGSCHDPHGPQVAERPYAPLGFVGYVKALLGGQTVWPKGLANRESATPVALGAAIAMPNARQMIANAIPTKSTW